MRSHRRPPATALVTALAAVSTLALCGHANSEPTHASGPAASPPETTRAARAFPQAGIQGPTPIEAAPPGPPQAVPPETSWSIDLHASSTGPGWYCITATTGPQPAASPAPQRTRWCLPLAPLPAAMCAFPLLSAPHLIPSPSSEDLIPAVATSASARNAAAASRPAEQATRDQRPCPPALAAHQE
jgi:hypothetical protein